MDLKTKSKRNPGGEHCLEKSAGPSENSDSPSNKIAESNPTHQDSSLLSQTTNSGDELRQKKSSRSLEEVMAPSIVAMNLKLNPSPATASSQETDYNKENFDPETLLENLLMRIDDCDNDLLRFEDDDEDEDEEDDELRDMIISQFKEDPTNKDRRNELHQKWLEQQDAAGTEKLLQKLKRGLQDETSLSEDGDEDDVADGQERA